MVAIDAKRVADGRAPRWEIFTHGGRKPTGIDAVAWAVRMAELGAGNPAHQHGSRRHQERLRTGRDRAITDAVEIPVIASGGVGNLDHLVDGILLGGADAVLAASIFHFGEFSVPEAKAYMAARGIEVRL